MLFCSCAQTDVRIYGHGQLAAYAHIQGDSQKISLTTTYGSFNAEGLKHSQATLAGGQVITSTTAYASILSSLLRLFIPMMP